MTTVLVIGNSHVGAMKMAVDAGGPETDDMDIEFFAAVGPHFHHLSFSKDMEFGDVGPKALPDDIRDTVQRFNGRSKVNLKEYDVVLWVGSGMVDYGFLEDLLDVYDVDGIRETDAANRMSAAAFRAVVGDSMDRNLAQDGFHQLRDVRMVVLPRPREAETLLKSGKYDALRANSAGLRQAYEITTDLYTKRLSELGIACLPHLQDTLAPSGLTLDIFSRGSAPLYKLNEQEHPAGDTRHMNREYGRLCWKAFRSFC